MRKVIEGKGNLIPVYNEDKKSVVELMCRFRTLGCIPCTGAVKSNAATIDDITEEVKAAKRSERENRLIDFTSDASMEEKKKEGYF